MDTELFMECEEEELEPWQQVDDSVEEDEMDFMDSYCEPVEDSLSPLPASETPPPKAPFPVAPAPTVSSSLQVVSSSVMAAPPPPSIITSSSAPLLSGPSTPAAKAPPLMAQAPPLILTQTANGTFLLPAAPGGGSAPSILLTAQGFPVMNNGAPLLLNLQPSQTVQPLTLIQSPPLGQLVHSNVGVAPIVAQGQTAQTRPVAAPAPLRAPAQPGSTFTTMQLPPTLTIRTGAPGPVNLQMTQVGGANTLKLAGSPALPSGSANGVNGIPPLNITPGPASFVMAPTVLTSDPPRVVMSVEEFYYGTYEGDLSLRKPQPLGLKVGAFACQMCSHRAENNLRLMQHMLQHSELIGGGRGGDEKKFCKFCYRQFSSPGQLQSHQDQVHGAILSPCMCRICEWAFENEPAFLNHMKSNHKPGEMPYVCQVCSYRSSFYSDVLQHFASFHRESRFLLCVFCLKVTRNPSSYQQHLLRHHINQAFHCNRCRLQFIFLKDKMQHKLENHRSFRRPAKLEGLPPGSKVTIRTYGKMRPLMTSGASRTGPGSAPLIQPINIKTEPQKSLVQSRAHRWPLKKPLDRKVSVNRGDSVERLVCLECGTNASDFAAHYPTHVRCLLCLYSSCCSRAYAAHMIHHHVPRSKDTVVPLHRRPPPCVFLLHCSDCDFRTQIADQMAYHLLMNPEHYSATCRTRTYVEPDIQLCISKEQRSSEEREPEPVRDRLDPSWRLADCWAHLGEGDITEYTIAPFQESSGPRHQLAKSSEAVDFFNLLFPGTLVELITMETNAHAKTCKFMGSSLPDWVPVTVHEVRGFIGLVILMGIQNLPDMSHYWSWSHYDNSYTFCRTMSLKRFKEIAANIRMGSFATDEYSGAGGKSTDSLRIFRPMLETLGGAMWDAYRPNCSLVIDRAHLPCLEEKSQAGQSPRTKPQVWLLCDSKSGYCHRFFIQVGEKAGQDPGFTVVPELVKGLENKHHHLYLANSLTSVPLLQKLLDQGVYASSSFPPPSSVLPRELWEEGQLENPGDFLQWQFGPLLATRWRDVKEMGCLSTNAAPAEPDTVWRRSQNKVGELDPIERPMAFRLLQENMRGVDICKQLLACNPLGGTPQDRHWRSLFWFLVNLSIVNAFIVLRESRKESPPPWVQDGLFTQVAFRKRLGNQLAKCAQKYFEGTETPPPRMTRAQVPAEQVKHRHRMAKISSISKRCKNCNLKNIRHESVSGCIVCQVNLCKQPSCFWEFHGLSPLNKGSTKVGFLKDSISGAVEVDEVQAGGDMAPLDDMDFSDDEDLEDVEDVEEFDDELDVKEEFDPEGKCSPRRLPSPADVQTQPGNAPCDPTHGGGLLTARQLRIVLYALCEGLGQASRVLLTDTQLICSWLREARKHVRQAEREGGAHADGTNRMIAWVLSMREQQLPITESNLLHKAAALKKRGAFGDSFRVSYDWAVSFMLHHRLGVRIIGKAATLAQSLPLPLEAKMKAFREFTQKVIKSGELPGRSVAAMDELCLFLDLSLLQDGARCSEALGLSGSLPLVTVYLAVLADGTMLPSLVLANTRPVDKVLPDFIRLAAGPESLTAGEAMDLWTDKVWHQHVAGPTLPRKSVLVLDRHRGHLGDAFLTSIGELGTLPALIPGGCSSHLQPLEVCMKPVLQRLLLSRWAKFAAGKPKELEETSHHRLRVNVATVLVDWLVEALAHTHTLRDVWRTSFLLTGVQREEETPQDIQLELIKTLTDTLLGPEAPEVNCPELMELEEEEDTAEEEEHRDMEAEEQVEDTDAEKEDKEEKREEPRVHREEVRKETKERGSLEDAGKETKDRKDRHWTERDKDEPREGRTEGVKERGEDTEGKEKETQEHRGEEIKKLEKKLRVDRKEEGKEAEEDSEEEGKEAEEERKEVSKERRETRIVIGEEVGDEWKITVKSRTEGGDES